jgi:uncharacterized membrane protein YebE (DUF533 family)
MGYFDTSGLTLSPATTSDVTSDTTSAVAPAGQVPDNKQSNGFASSISDISGSILSGISAYASIQNTLKNQTPNNKLNPQQSAIVQNAQAASLQNRYLKWGLIAAGVLVALVLVVRKR